MADPVSLTAMMAVGGMAATAAGGIVGAYGQVQQGAATAAQQNYQAAVADMNSKVAQQDAAYAEAAGETRAQEIGMKGRAQVGTTRAGFGASNVSGVSQENVTRSETAITQFEEASTRADAAKQAYGYRVKAASDTAQAGAYRAGAVTAVTAADIGAASTVLGTAGQVSTRWLQGQQAGIFNTDGSSPGVNPDSAAGQATYAASIYS